MAAGSGSKPSRGDKPKVKVVGRGLTHRSGANLLARQLPSSPPEDWPDFTFDPEARDYDWLAVYDNLPPTGQEKVSMRVEELACPPENTILVTTEPSSIKTYDTAFVNQFARVITTLEPEILRHPGRIATIPGLRWFYGMGRDHLLDYDTIARQQPGGKTDAIGMMSSAKRNTHTRHLDRYRFTMALAEHMPEAAIFGHGLKEIDDKAQAIDPYRYQVAIENHIAPHHITEKVTDAFLGYALPFYFGAPNLADYFPEDSFIPIDIQDPGAAIEIMREAVAGGAYEKRLPAILEARRLVLEEHNLLAIIARETMTARGLTPPRPAEAVLSQRAARLGNPGLSLLDRGRHSLRRLTNHWQRRKDRNWR